MFGKPLSSLTSGDLAALVESQAIENVRLEFKLEDPSKAEMLKKLSSFANTFGGYLIVGARAQSTDGRLIDIPGIEASPGFKQRIVQWCYDGASPPLLPEVSDAIPAGTDTSRVAYVVHVPESGEAPHFLNGRKGVYVRSDEYSQLFEPSLATEPELRQMFDRRSRAVQRRGELLDRAVRRYAAFETSAAEAANEIAHGTAEFDGARMLLSLTPRFPSQVLWDHTTLRRLIERDGVTWKNSRFPSVVGGVVSQHESVIVLRPTSRHSILEANTWGMLFYASDIEHLETQAFTGIHVGRFAGQLLVFLRHAVGVFRALGIAGSLEVGLSLERIRGVPWITYERGNFPEIGASSVLDSDAATVLTVSGEALLQDTDKIVADLLAFAFRATNWAEAAEDAATLSRMLKLGYQYNGWKA